MGKTETGVPEKKVNRFLTNIFSTIDKLNSFKIFTGGVKEKDKIYVILGNQWIAWGRWRL